MKHSKLLIDIKQNIAKYTNSEHKIAEFILNNPDQASKITITEMAQICDTSKPSVSRFVKSIGFDSYRDFQNALFASLFPEQPETIVYQNISNIDSAEHICHKVFENNVRALHETLSTIDIPLLESALKLMKKARYIHIFAQGRSRVVAESLQNRFYRIGIHCFIYSDPHTEAVVSSTITPQDLAIGISNFGRSKSVINSIRRAKENGCPTIALTGFNHTKLSAIADLNISVVSHQIHSKMFEPSCETAALIVLIDCLYIMYILSEQEKVNQYFIKSDNAIEEEKY